MGMGRGEDWRMGEGRFSAGQAQSSRSSQEKRRRPLPSLEGVALLPRSMEPLPDHPRDQGLVSSRLPLSSFFILQSSIFSVHSSVFIPYSSSGIGGRGSGLKARPPTLQAPGSRLQAPGSRLTALLRAGS